MFTYYFVLQDGHLYLWQASLQTSQVFDCISHSFLITKMIRKTKFCRETTVDVKTRCQCFLPQAPVKRLGTNTILLLVHPSSFEF